METKKEKIVSAAATIGIVLMLFGATYAYFASRTDAGKITDVKITANTVDVLTFEIGDSISITLDQDNFASGTGNQMGSTFAKATLTPNNKTNTATDYYYVYLNISNNTFSYSLGSDKPEILLQVTDTDGATVTSLDGLTYSTVTNGSGESVSGFDITTKTGLITLANNKEITANTDTNEETWNISVVFVNYNDNQAVNAGNSFKAKLMIQKNELLAGWVIAQYTNQILGSETIYLHDENLTNGAGDNSYRYAGASTSVNNFVCFGSDEIACPDDNLYRIVGVFDGQVKLIKWDYATSALLGTDGDYKNTASEGNLGTSKGTNAQTAIGAYWWNNKNKSVSSCYNVWGYSKLNIVNLNTNFLNNIGTEWKNKIAETTWKVGGNNSELIVNKTSKFAYQNEIKNPSTQVSSTYEVKIGLAYVSDYGFAADSHSWDVEIYDYSLSDVKNGNWMYMGLDEWTITRSAGSNTGAYKIYSTGSVSAATVDNYFGAIRPVFYLESSVNYVSGDGTKTNPITLS